MQEVNIEKFWSENSEDVYESLLNGACGLVPVVGDALATAIKGVLPRKKEEDKGPSRVEVSLEDIKTQLKEISEQIKETQLFDLQAGTFELVRTVSRGNVFRSPKIDARNSCITTSTPPKGSSKLPDPQKNSRMPSRK